jgi:hypothetical protein
MVCLAQSWRPNRLAYRSYAAGCPRRRSGRPVLMRSRNAAAVRYGDLHRTLTDGGCAGLRPHLTGERYDGLHQRPADGRYDVSRQPQAAWRYGG